MKRIFFICLVLTFCAASQAQIIVKEQTQKITTPVTTTNTVIKNPAPQIQLTQGRDMGIRIDRVEDISTFDENIYTIYYTFLNSGTENLNIAFQKFKIEAIFYRPDDSYVGSGGITNTSALGKTWLNSAETVQGTLVVRRSDLVRNAAYKLRLSVDADNRLYQDVNKSNDASTTNVTARAIRNSDYFLTSAKVIIQTGNDNKEAQNSKVNIYAGPANFNDHFYFKYEINEELKVNSTTELNLKPAVSTPDMYSDFNRLSFYKQQGVALAITYDNNAWATDAWKINNVTVMLEFKDKNGNPYPLPVYSNVTISFSNASGLLGYRAGDDITKNENQLRLLTLGTDNNFNPKAPAFRKKQIRYLDVAR
ncbi:hypothetical protein [Lacibacter sediminis]|uniref:DUF5103 domain-containing protein n=1 Tax=Lacibacter sediminis TaxID=2760713 RepID=A0A7G5XMB4_9BACT|nr:hypothetical protein [Lacibacter sediminis]QNA46617.1 hypothetical protein H4075_10735 [Lacibacter sediminis]